MSAGIKKGVRRRAIYRSKSANQAMDSLTTCPINGNELAPPSPCSGYLSSPAEIPEHNSIQTWNNKKETIMTEIKREVVKPVMDELSLIRSELHSIKDLMHPSQHDSLHKCVRAECETRNNVYNTKEPEGLFRASMEEEQQYQDECQARASRLQARSIENQLYGYPERPGEKSEHRNDCARGEKDNQHAGHENEILEIKQPKDFRSSSLQTRVKTVAVVPRPRSAIHIRTAEFDERECLANALQFHIEDLVDGLVFNESELPDCLVTEDCLTEDECSMVRKLRDRKDQIRILLSLIKGRDLRVLKGFMKHIAQHNPGVAQKIGVKFENNKREGIRGKLCALCKLRTLFNVKRVADGLWAIQAIDDGLYNKIIYSDTPVGAQDALWKKVFLSLNGLGQQKAREAHEKLIHALSNKNLFMHLADGVKNMLIRNHGLFACACEPRLILPKGVPSLWGSSESFLPDSSSDGTSYELTSSDGIYDLDNLKRKSNYAESDGMSRIDEVNEIPLSNSSIVANESQQEDNTSATHQNVGKYTSIDTYSVHTKSSFISEVKPPVPPRKSGMNTTTLTKDSSPERLPLNSGQMTDNYFEVETDVAPPLPEKKNKYVKIVTQYYV